MYDQVLHQNKFMVPVGRIAGVSISFKTENDAKADVYVTKINPDGYCFYAALAHQIWNMEVDSDEHVRKTNQLLAEAIDDAKHKLSDPVFFDAIAGMVADKFNEKNKNKTKKQPGEISMEE